MVQGNKICNLRMKSVGGVLKTEIKLAKGRLFV